MKQRFKHLPMLAPGNVVECPRCQGLIQYYAPRHVIDGKDYHAYCGSRKAEDENLLQQRIGDRPIIPTK